MTESKRPLSFLLVAIAAAILSACHTEDPGPLQSFEKSFSVFDFDRLDIGSAFDVRVTEGSEFTFSARGDRRNIDDLQVYTSGTTLIARFGHNAHRNHQTIITITMPALESVRFSDAVAARILGFQSDGDLEIQLSGASTCQVDADYNQVKAKLSAASNLRLLGAGDMLQAELSGASELLAIQFPVREADVSLSGASSGRVKVTDHLKAVATGASSLLYSGSPTVAANVSGASTIRQE